MTILFVDDDANDRSMFEEAVMELNPNAIVMSAKSAEQALDMLTFQLPKAPDYIFIDINKPRGDSMACVALIKGHQQLRKIPLIVLSSGDQPAERLTVKKMGAKFLAKHSDYRKIVKDISQILLPVPC
jgi:CheY-like chemotaxis protein